MNNEHEKINAWSVTDKLENWQEYVWAILISAFIYLFAFIGLVEFSVLSAAITFVAIYVVKSLLRLALPDLSPKFNIFLEIAMLAVAVVVFVGK